MSAAASMCHLALAVGGDGYFLDFAKIRIRENSFSRDFPKSELAKIPSREINSFSIFQYSESAKVLSREIFLKSESAKIPSREIFRIKVTRLLKFRRTNEQTD